MTTNWDYERVATQKEKDYAIETERLMAEAGYTGTYAGGSRSKGNGFWLTGIGYKNCRAIRKMIKENK